MMRAMNDESLARAAGGNFGDWEIEWKTGTPLYREGDVVEVYTSHLMHFFTKRGTIISVSPVGNKYFAYLVILSNGDYVEAIADDIERK